MGGGLFGDSGYRGTREGGGITENQARKNLNCLLSTGKLKVPVPMRLRRFVSQSLAFSAISARPRDSISSHSSALADFTFRSVLTRLICGLSEQKVLK